MPTSSSPAVTQRSTAAASPHLPGCRGGVGDRAPAPSPPGGARRGGRRATAPAAGGEATSAASAAVAGSPSQAARSISARGGHQAEQHVLVQTRDQRPRPGQPLPGGRIAPADLHQQPGGTHVRGHLRHAGQQVGLGEAGVPVAGHVERGDLQVPQLRGIERPLDAELAAPAGSPAASRSGTPRSGRASNATVAWLNSTRISTSTSPDRRARSSASSSRRPTSTGSASPAAPAPGTRRCPTRHCPAPATSAAASASSAAASPSAMRPTE